MRGKSNSVASNHGRALATMLHPCTRCNVVLGGLLSATSIQIAYDGAAAENQLDNRGYRNETRHLIRPSNMEAVDLATQ